MNSSDLRITGRLAALLMVLTFAACGQLERGAADPELASDQPDALSATTTATDAPTFQANIGPLLWQLCGSRCHGVGNPTANVETGDPKTDYPVILKLIDREDPAASRLLQKATATISHGGGQIIDAASDPYKKILAWISAGAPFAAGAETGTTSAMSKN